MRAGVLHYTVGAYNESPEGTLSLSGPALLAETLSWAVQNDMPFHEIMLSLMQSAPAGYNRTVFLLPRSKRWEICLRAAYSDLVHGMPLYETLRRRFAYFLPEYYLQAVEKAEKEGHLKEVLPVFARRLRFTVEVRKNYRQALSLPCVEFILLCAVLSFLCVFIFPNFSKIFDDLLQKPYSDSHYQLIFPWIQAVWRWFWRLILITLIIGILGRIFIKSRRFILMLLGELFIYIPPFRKYLKNAAFLELSASMASYLDMGEDVLNAAKFSEKACNYFWLKRKLKKFIRRMENGENWLTAWNSMELKQNLGECLIRNAAAREKIAAGFDALSDWLYHKQVGSVKKNAVLLFVSGVAINAVMVFLIMFYVFHMLIQIIYAS
jgi:type II secretory pathway component PulF